MQISVLLLLAVKGFLTTLKIEPNPLYIHTLKFLQLRANSNVPGKYEDMWLSKIQIQILVA